MTPIKMVLIMLLKIKTEPMYADVDQAKQVSHECRVAKLAKTKM